MTRRRDPSPGGGEVTAVLDRHVAELGRRLRGPAALREDMLAEVRAGLVDATEAAADAGAPDPAARAVAEFGAAADLAPLYQAELTTAQVRRTALLVAVLFPALVLGWDLSWSNGIAWDGPAPAGLGVLTRAQDIVGAAAATAALLLLLGTLRRRARPRLLAVAVAVVGLGGAVLCVAAAVAMHVVQTDALAEVLASGGAALPMYAASLASVTAVAVSSARSLRLAR